MISASISLENRRKDVAIVNDEYLTLFYIVAVGLFVVMLVI